MHFQGDLAADGLLSCYKDRPSCLADDLPAEVNIIISDEDIVRMVKGNLSLDKLLQGPAKLTVKLAADNHELVEVSL